MYKVFATAFAIALLFVGASAQTTQTQSQTIDAEVTLTTPSVKGQVVPRTKQVTQNVRVPVNPKPQPKGNYRYVRRTSTVNNGYDVVIPETTTTATVKINAEQIQTMVTDQVGPIQDDLIEIKNTLDDQGREIVSLKSNQVVLVNGLNSTNKRVGALEQYTIKNNQNIQNLDNRMVVQENRKDKTRGFLDYLNLGLNAFNTVVNVIQMGQINKLQNGQVNNNGNTCRGRWVNGRCVTGGGGGNPCPIRGMRCNNGGGGPIRVCNGLPCQPGQGNQIGNTPETNQVETPLGSQVVINGSQSYNPNPVIYTNTAYVAPVVVGSSGGPVRVR